MDWQSLLLGGQAGRGASARWRRSRFPSSTPSPTSPRATDIRELVDCVLSNGTPETTAADNITGLAMVFGAIESADSDRRVTIGE